MQTVEPDVQDNYCQTKPTVDGSKIEQLEQEEKVRMLEARIYQLTEDKDLMKRELELNNTWVNEQETMRATIDQLELSRRQLYTRNRQLQLQLE